jgi:enamine deaminase RidA (YjgF/YER057c/UK114 family)
MNGKIEARLRELSIELPKASTPGANYVPFVRTGGLLVITGQLSQWNGERRFVGKLGREFEVEDGKKAARLCALNLIAHARVALGGDLDKIASTVRLAGYINGTPEFTAHSQVMNGASDLFVEIFGDAGRHTRIAVGVNALPYDVAVEVEAMFEVTP